MRRGSKKQTHRERQRVTGASMRAEARRIDAFQALRNSVRSGVLVREQTTSSARTRLASEVSAVAASKALPKSPALDAVKKDAVLQDRKSCKSRPEPKKGGGGGRGFVPWCNRK